MTKSGVRSFRFLPWYYAVYVTLMDSDTQEDVGFFYDWFCELDDVRTQEGKASNER